MSLLITVYKLLVKTQNIVLDSFLGQFILKVSKIYKQMQMFFGK